MALNHCGSGADSGTTIPPSKLLGFVMTIFQRRNVQMKVIFNFKIFFGRIHLFSSHKKYVFFENRKNVYFCHNIP